MGFLYTSPQELAAFGSFDYDSESALLGDLVEASSRAIDSHTGRTFFATGSHAARTFYANDWSNSFDEYRGVLLFGADLCEMSFISGNPSGTYLPVNGGPPWHGFVCLEGSHTPPVTVSGSWAYSLTPPADIQLATLRLGRWLYSLRETARGDNVIITPEGQVLVPSNLPPDVLALIGPYRKPRMAGSGRER